MSETEARTMDGKHLKYVLLVVVAVFALLVTTGPSFGTALLIALVLSCPLMMVVMLLGGGRAPSRVVSRARPPATTKTTARRPIMPPGAGR
jgi:hypothetical protein